MKKQIGMNITAESGNCRGINRNSVVKSSFKFIGHNGDILLLSGQVESFIDAVGVKMRGNTMRCQAQYLRMLHIPYSYSLRDVEAEGFRQAFRTRDRVLATVFMERLIGRMTGNGRNHEAGVAEVV